MLITYRYKQPKRINHLQSLFLLSRLAPFVFLFQVEDISTAN